MELKNHLEKLEAFWHVAQARSFSRAAEALHVAQPSVSRAVHVLEEVIGAPLFVRLTGRVTPTPRGEQLLDYCNRLFVDLKDLETRLHTPDEEMAGHIHVGTYESIAIYFWPRFLKLFLQLYPKVTIDLTTSRSATLAEMLRRGQVDLTVSVEPLVTKGMQRVALYEDEFRLYGASGLETDSRCLIFMPDAISGRQETLAESMARAGLRFERKIATTSFETVRALTREGLGCGLLPTRVAAQELETGAVEEMGEESGPIRRCLGRHRICASFPEARSESPLYRRFVTSFRTFLDGPHLSKAP